MNSSPHATSFDEFFNFGDMLKYLRRRERLTQLELSIAVGYSEAQISRLEKNKRLPDLTTLRARFIPALNLQDEPHLTARFLELAQSARQQDTAAAAKNEAISAKVSGVVPSNGRRLTAKGHWTIST